MDRGYYRLQRVHLDSSCLFGNSNTKSLPASVSDKDGGHPRLHTVSSLRSWGTTQPHPRQPLLVDSHAPIHGTSVPSPTLYSAITTLQLQDKLQ